MAISTVADLARILRQLPLLEPTQLDALAGPLAKQFSDPKLLARELARHGWLTPFQVNQIFQGRAANLVLGSYVLLDRLGEGGMGEVFKARNWKLGRVVALKLVRKERVSRPETIRRFHREIRAAAKLIHPNVVHAHDADEVNGTHFFTMDYVEGVDLAKHVRQSGPLPIPVACEYIRQAALGLQHAHEHGMVHRDIKPHNLIVSVARSGKAKSDEQKPTDVAPVIKILDMGLALLQQTDDGDHSSTSLTQEGLVLGTVDYVAPEQALNAHHADIRADIYSLGCTLYFLLTGQVPFPGGTATEKLIRHQCDPCVPVESLRPDVSPGLAALMRRLMAKRPDERPQTPAELADALQRLLSGDDAGDAHVVLPPRPAAALAASAFAAIDATGEVIVDSDSALARARARPSPVKALWIGAAAFAAFLIITTVIWLRPRDPRPGPPPVKNEPTMLVYRVDAGRRWQDTSIDVKAGAPLAITFKGKWQVKGGQESGAEGNEKAPRSRAVAIDVPALCVLARIGNAEGMIPLGLLKEFKPAADGRLFVQPNTLDLDELAGTIRLEIKGGSAGQETLPAPALVHTQRADADLRALQSRLLQRKEGADALRHDLLEFTTRYRDTLPGLAAAELVMPLASPLDVLDATRLAPDILAAAGGGDPARAPLGLVAVLGRSGAEEGNAIVALVRSRDDRRLAALAARGGARVWDVPAEKPLAGPWEQGSVSALAMSADGKRLAAVVGKTSVKEWDIDGGKLLSSKEADAAAACLDYSGDGDRLAAGLDDGSVIVWKSGTSTEVFRGKEEKTEIVRVQFRADGRLASSAANRSMRLWDLTGVKKDAAWHAHELAEALAFRPDGGVLALAGKSLRLVDPATGQVLFTVRNPDKTRGDYVAEYRADGAVLFFADGKGKLILWDAATHHELRRWDLPRRATSLASSSDGRHVFTGNRDGTVFVLRLGPSQYAAKAKTVDSNPLDKLRHADIPDAELALATDRLTDAPPPELVAVLGRGPLWHGSTVRALAISPDGKHIASAGNDHLVKTWDAATGKLLGQCKGHTADVLSLAYSPDGAWLASAGRDHTVRLWDAAAHKQREMFRDNLGDVVSLAFDARAEQLACGTNHGGIKVLNMRPGKALPWISGHNGLVNKLAFSADGATIYSAGVDGRALVRRLGSSKPSAELDGLANLTHASAFLPGNGGMIAVDADGKAISVDWIGERDTLPLEGSPRVHGVLTLSSDGKTLAIDDADGNIRLHDRATGRLIGTLSSRFPVVSLAFSGNGERLLVETAHGIRVWDIGSRKESAMLTGHRGAVRDLAVSPDGKTLLSGGLEGSILMWDLGRGEIREGLPGDGTPLTNLAISPEGGRLAASSRGGWIKAWTLPAGRPIFARKLGAIPNDLAWSPDGQQLVIAFHTGTLETWEAASGRETSSRKAHPKGITCIAFSGDGQRFASGGDDRAVKLWQWRPFRELSPFYMTHPIDSLAFAPDGERLAIASNGVHYKDTVRAKSAGELEGNKTSPIRLAYHPSKAFLASADAAGRLNIWNDTTNVGGWQFRRPLHSVAFSADGRYLFAGSDTGAILILRVAEMLK